MGKSRTWWVYYDVRQYLDISGVSSETIDLLYDARGNWRYSFPEIDPYNYSPEELLEVADEILTPIHLTGHESAARGIHPLMNSHRWPEHGKHVANYALQLVRQAGYGEDVQRNTVLATAAHDMANIVSRQGHNRYGGGHACSRFSSIT